MAGKITTEPVEVIGTPMIRKMLLSAARQGKTSKRLFDEFVIIGIDPGETTGFAVYKPWEQDDVSFRLHLQQLETKNVVQGYQALEAAWPTTRLKVVVVCEDYKVYGWKANDHKWASLHTPQFIGGIRIFCHLRGIPIFFQMAGEAKGWSTDEKLKLWSLYEPGLKHARDAERHIINFLFFGGSNSKVKAFLDTYKLPVEDDEDLDYLGDQN